MDSNNHLMHTLEVMSKNIDRNTVKCMNKAIKLVEGSARLKCPVNYGELRQSIHSMVETGERNIVGICYAAKSYAPFVELGTGPRGEANHVGISPDVSPIYSQSGWWIHESQISQAVARKYHFFSIKTKDGKFYYTSGQPAQPFMYPALRDNQARIVGIFQGALKGKL